MPNPAKYLLAAAVVTSILVAAPLALGAGEGNPLKGGTRNPSTDTSKSFARETQVIANVATYGTRQSNKSATGGGAVYGCRAAASSSNTCVRATNLADGQAFSFSGRGASVGRIEAGSASAKPFTTNATGVATGLNADQVDGKSASEITSDAVQSANLFARVGGTAGTLGSARGATGSVRDGAGVYRVVFSGDVSGCAATATQSSAAAGSITVEPVTIHEVRVRTFNDAAPAVATDRDFNLTVTC